MSKATNHLKQIDGNELKLTSGKHGKLLFAVLTKFVPHFAPEATVLYMSDITNKSLLYKQEQLEKLEVPIIAHDQFPDIILYQEARNSLYLIEIVAPGSNGPVSHERRLELERILAGCSTERIYLSVFQQLTDFARYASDIAYESHTWIAETPEHMIHYNGDKFLGPHKHDP
jgi:hypothetical protein